ncbi:hypothetical protein DN536_33665, partial [Burkholderia multivorans]
MRTPTLRSHARSTASATSTWCAQSPPSSGRRASERDEGPDPRDEQPVPPPPVAGRHRRIPQPA